MEVVLAEKHKYFFHVPQKHSEKSGKEKNYT